MLAGGGVLVGGQLAHHARTRRHQPGEVLVVPGGPELTVVALDVVPNPRPLIQGFQLVDVLVVFGRRGRMVVHPDPVGVIRCPDGFPVVVHPILVTSGIDRLQNVAGLVLVVAAVIELALLGDIVGLALGIHDRVVVGILRGHRQPQQVVGHVGLDQVGVADAVGGGGVVIRISTHGRAMIAIFLQRVAVVVQVTRPGLTRGHWPPSVVVVAAVTGGVSPAGGHPVAGVELATMFWRRGSVNRYRMVGIATRS